MAFKKKISEPVAVIAPEAAPELPAPQKAALPKISRAHLEKLQFAREEGKPATIDGYDISGLDCDGVDLRSARIINCDASGSSFKNAMLDGTDWTGTDKTGTDFTDASVRFSVGLGWRN